ncbi:hypothetical protein [Nocardia noduli]|uniref:hypothetical protein n=1 Tax=Nocardia noduli TaxID=2815722 RepID=UPI001C238BEF|nr:hypothetical protein [Nocardia noduli]
MDIDPALVARDRELAALASRRYENDDWMAEATRRSANSLRDLVHEAWMPARPGVIARFHDGEVSGHTAPAYQVLRAAYEFNDAVVAVANGRLTKPAATINDAVRKRLGLLIRPVLAGSIQIDLVAPLPGMDETLTIPGTDQSQELLPNFLEVQSPSNAALNTVLGVLRQISVATSEESMSTQRDEVGSDGWRKLARLTRRCIDAGFTIDFASRVDPQDRFSFTPLNAHSLSSLIRERSLTAVEVNYVGLWQTASAVRSWFDLQTDDLQRVSGTVPQNLIEDSMGLLGQRVRAIVQEDVDPDKERLVLKRTLVSLQPDFGRALPRQRGPSNDIA